MRIRTSKPFKDGLGYTPAHKLRARVEVEMAYDGAMEDAIEAIQAGYGVTIRAQEHAPEHGWPSVEIIGSYGQVCDVLWECWHNGDDAEMRELLLLVEVRP